MKDMSKPFIINCEVFLQCHGYCSGCFLSELERKEDNNHLSKIANPLLKLLTDNKSDYSHFVVGFGRGNLLNMSDNSLSELLELIDKCEKIVSGRATYEISTSLIGKIDKQVAVANYLIKKNINIYFNVVINSEITSQQFWENWNIFYKANVHLRESMGLTDYTGDIVVLNVNPRKLPDLTLLERSFGDKPSPLNISLFPFDTGLISQQDLDGLNSWSTQMYEMFKSKDLNVKNYLDGLESVGLGTSIQDTLDYHGQTLNSYFFVDKNGSVVPGSSSIMGEVDYVRLLEKYATNISPAVAIKKMQKNKTCVSCEHQQKCVLSGAYLNMIHNAGKSLGTNGCLSGYKGIFENY